MSHACRGTRAFAHLVVLGSRIVRNCTSSPVGATAALLALVTALAPNVAFAIPPGSTKVEMSLDGVTIKNPCTGEIVILSGTREFFIYFKDQKNGGTEIITRVRSKGTGTSLSGATYTFNSEVTSKFGDVPPGDFHAVALEKIMLIRHGELLDHSADDWMFRDSSRIVVDEVGNVQVFREALTDTCPA